MPTGILRRDDQASLNDGVIGLSENLRHLPASHARLLVEHIVDRVADPEPVARLDKAVGLDLGTCRLASFAAMIRQASMMASLASPRTCATFRRAMRISSLST